METIRFMGFSYFLGGGMSAAIKVTDKDTYEPYHVNINIVLKPGEEPTEWRILKLFVNA